MNGQRPDLKQTEKDGNAEELQVLNPPSGSLLSGSNLNGARGQNGNGRAGDSNSFKRGPQTYSFTQSPPQPQSQPKDGRKAWIWVSMTILIVIFIIIGTVVYVSQSTIPNPKPGPPNEIIAITTTTKKPNITIPKYERVSSSTTTPTSTTFSTSTPASTTSSTSTSTSGPTSTSTSTSGPTSTSTSTLPPPIAVTEKNISFVPSNITNTTHSMIEDHLEADHNQSQSFDQVDSLYVTTENPSMTTESGWFSNFFNNF